MRCALVLCRVIIVSALCRHVADGDCEGGAWVGVDTWARAYEGFNGESIGVLDMVR